MLKKTILAALWCFGLSLQPAGAATVELGDADLAVLTTDDTSPAGPFGWLSGYGEGFGLGCVDGRYCDIGSFSVATRNGSNVLSLNTQRLQVKNLPISSVVFGGNTVVISARTLLEILDPAYDPDTFTGFAPPTVTVTNVVLTFSNLAANQSLAFGNLLFDSTATASVALLTAVPVPASGLLLVTAIVMLRRRRST